MPVQNYLFNSFVYICRLENTIQNKANKYENIGTNGGMESFL